MANMRMQNSMNHRQGFIEFQLVDDLESALEQMRLIAEDLGEGALNR